MFYPDLNLLRVFDLLFEERSVSRVAQRLNLTQSAVSHALARLRDMLGDPLFVRSPGGLHATARAEQLAPQLRESLVRIRAALNPLIFDPDDSGRDFTVAAGSYFSRLLGPSLIARARARAPGVSLRIVNIDQALLDQLDQGTVDLAIGSFGQVPARIKSALLFRESLIWVSSRDHPLAGTHPDKRTLAAQPSIAIVVDYPYRVLRSDGAGERMTRPTIVGGVDGPAGALQGSHVCARVFDPDTAASVAGRSDLLAILPRRFALARAEEEGLHLFEALTDGEDIELMMLWHERFAEDAGLAWLRGLVAEVSKAEA